jgi:hypothetical protein
VEGVQTGTISKLLLGIKSHLDVGAMERWKVWAMVSLVSPKLPMACPSTKGAQESELTNSLVG